MNNNIGEVIRRGQSGGAGWLAFPYHFDGNDGPDSRTAYV